MPRSTRPAPQPPHLAGPDLDEPHPGRATYRGLTVLPDGTALRVRPASPARPDHAHQDGDTDPETVLRPAGQTRRVLGRRLPVLTGYTGGTIPTNVEGSVRVGGPAPAFWLWLALTAPAFVGVLFAAAANNTRAALAVCGAYLAAFVLLAALQAAFTAVKGARR